MLATRHLVIPCHVQALKDPYPHKWPVDASIPTLIEKYKDMPPQSQEEGTVVTIAGRVKNKRNQGANMVFYDLFADGAKIQIMCQAQHHKVGDFKERGGRTLSSTEVGGGGLVWMRALPGSLPGSRVPCACRA